VSREVVARDAAAGCLTRAAPLRAAVSAAAKSPAASSARVASSEMARAAGDGTAGRACVDSESPTFVACAAPAPCGCAGASTGGVARVASARAVRARSMRTAAAARLHQPMREQPALEIRLDLAHYEPRQPTRLLRALEERRPVRAHHAMQHSVLGTSPRIAVRARCVSKFSTGSGNGRHRRSSAYRLARCSTCSTPAVPPTRPSAGSKQCSTRGPGVGPISSPTPTLRFIGKPA